MLRLSKKIEYALLATQFIATKQELVSAKEIADSLGISFEFLAKTLQTLNRKGIVNSHKGTNGGYKLGKPAKEISIADVIMALENKAQIVDCLTETDGQNCDRAEFCTIKQPLKELQTRIDKVFETTTIEDLKLEDISYFSTEQELVQIN